MSAGPRRCSRLLIVLSALLISGCAGGGAGVFDGALAWITGLVTRSRGEAIAGATVTLVETGQQSTTDAAGRYVIGTDHRGRGTLRAEAPEFLTLEWPVTLAGGVTTHNLRLVSMADFDAALFRELTGATDTRGTWRWDASTVTYYINRTGAYRPAFDAPLREAFTQWSMLTRRAVTFAEGGPDSAIQISFVASEPCGVAGAAGCAGVTRVTSQGAIRGALIELHAGYATDLGLAIHEVGHTLSFTGHSPNASDVMYYRMNAATAPGNQEAAAVTVLYDNPPGTTLTNVRYPAAQTSAAATAAPAASASIVAPAARPPHAFPAMPAQAPPALSALPDIGAMLRGWLGRPGCLLPLPFFCNSGSSGPTLRIW